MGVPPIPLARPAPMGRLRESIQIEETSEDNPITLEEAFNHAIKANKWEYLGVQLERWLSVGFAAQEVADALMKAFGGKRDSHAPLVEQERKYIDDGHGGLLLVDDMTPIQQIGRTEPIGYIDRDGNFYPVDQDKPRLGQYEDAAVSYEDC